MKKIIITILIIIVIAIMLFILKNNNKGISNNIEIMDTNVAKNPEVNTINDNRVDEEMDIIYVKINNKVLDIKIENNSATKELIERLKNGDIIVSAHEYGGFEKVGNLGFSLPKEDKNISTSSGDIVLYQGNQISLFYNSNSWSYTKLGKIININNDELKTILGVGDVTLTFTLNR